MSILNFINKLFTRTDTKENVKPMREKKEQVKSLCDGVDIEFIDEEEICKLDFFAGKCRYIKANPPEGMKPFRGEVFKSFILFNLPYTDTPDNISNVTVMTGENETYQIPNWRWDYMLELDYDNYKYAEMIDTVSNEHAIEADFNLIDKIKSIALNIYGDLIGDNYTADDLYTSCGEVIRKYTVIVKNKLTNDVILFKTFDDYSDAQNYYNNLLNIN